MSYSRSLAACDFASPTSPSSNATDPAAQKAAADAASRDQKAAAAAAHQQALQQQAAYNAGIQALTTAWSPLPLAPYPPASDTSSNFPRSGDPRLVLDRSSITASALAEPARVTAGMLAQAKARTPKPSLLFWVGLAALGVGIYVARH